MQFNSILWVLTIKYHQVRLEIIYNALCCRRMHVFHAVVSHGHSHRRRCTFAITIYIYSIMISSHLYNRTQNANFVRSIRSGHSCSVIWHSTTKTTFTLTIIAVQYALKRDNSALNSKSYERVHIWPSIFYGTGFPAHGRVPAICRRTCEGNNNNYNNSIEAIYYRSTCTATSGHFRTIAHRLDTRCVSDIRSCTIVVDIFTWFAYQIKLYISIATRGRCASSNLTKIIVVRQLYCNWIAGWRSRNVLQVDG